MFTAVNGFLAEAGRGPCFEVQLAGMAKEVRLYEGSVVIRPDVRLENLEHTDLILIPAIGGSMEKAIRINRAFFPWIVGQYKRGADVASLCTGAFLLAATGLADGKSCSTHWMFANEFRAMFPRVRLADDRVVTDENGICSSGGANSYWNLLLYLVEKSAGREMAVAASKFFQLDIHRDSQSPFAMFIGQRNHGDEEVLQAQRYIETGYRKRMTVDGLAERFGVGRRTFERRFRKATANSVAEYVQRVRIEAAKKHLERARKTVNEAMYEVGYGDIGAFRDLFRKITGLTPAAYRERYAKPAALPRKRTPLR